MEEKPKVQEVKSYSSFKEYLNHKIKGGFDTRKAPIHIKTAIDHCLKHFEKDDKGQPILYTTEVHYLAQSIYPFFKEMMSL